MRKSIVLLISFMMLVQFGTISFINNGGIVSAEDTFDDILTEDITCKPGYRYIARVAHIVRDESWDANDDLFCYIMNTTKIPYGIENFSGADDTRFRTDNWIVDEENKVINYSVITTQNGAMTWMTNNAWDSIKDVVYDYGVGIVPYPKKAGYPNLDLIRGASYDSEVLHGDSWKHNITFNSTNYPLNPWYGRWENATSASRYFDHHYKYTFNDMANTTIHLRYEYDDDPFAVEYKYGNGTCYWYSCSYVRPPRVFFLRAFEYVSPVPLVVPNYRYQSFLCDDFGITAYSDGGTPSIIYNLTTDDINHTQEVFSKYGGVVSWGWTTNANSHGFTWGEGGELALTYNNNDTLREMIQLAIGNGDGFFYHERNHTSDFVNGTYTQEEMFETIELSKVDVENLTGDSTFWDREMQIFVAAGSLYNPEYADEVFVTNGIKYTDAYDYDPYPRYYGWRTNLTNGTIFTYYRCHDSGLDTRDAEEDDFTNTIAQEINRKIRTANYGPNENPDYDLGAYSHRGDNYPTFMIHIYNIMEWEDDDRWEGMEVIESHISTLNNYGRKLVKAQDLYRVQAANYNMTTETFAFGSHLEINVTNASLYSEISVPGWWNNASEYQHIGDANFSIVRPSLGNSTIYLSKYQGVVNCTFNSGVLDLSDPEWMYFNTSSDKNETVSVAMIRTYTNPSIYDITAGEYVQWIDGSYLWDAVGGHDYKIGEYVPDPPVDPGETPADQINALIPIVIAATGVIVVLGILTNGFFRPLNRSFRKVKG